MKPAASPPWRPPGAGTSAWPQRGDRRGLPPHPPAPPPPRRSPLPHAASGRRGECRSVVTTGQQAGAGETGRGVARREAGRNAEGVAVAEHGERAAAGSAEARNEQGSDGTGRKRWAALPAQPPPKRRVVRPESRAPPDCWKDSAVPLGRNRDAGSSRPRSVLADGGSGAPEKAASRPPLAGSKDGVLLAGALPRAAAGTSVRPRAGGGHHGADTWVAKSSEALSQSIMAAADGLPDTGSQGAAGYTAKDRGRGAGTGKLRRKEMVLSTRLPPKPPIVSTECRVPGGGSNTGSLLGRGSRDVRLPLEAGYADGDFGLSKGVLATDVGSSAVNRRPCYGAVQDDELVEGKNACKVHPVEASIEHSSNENGEKSPSWNLTKDVKMLNISGRGSCNVVTKSSAQGPSKEYLNGKRVSDIGRMNRVSSDVPARMSSQSTMMGNKIVRAPGKAAKPAKVIGKSKVKEKETKHGGLVTTNGIVDTGNPTAGRIFDKRPMAQRNELATNFGPKKKGMVKAADHPLIKVVYALDSKEKLDCKVAFNTNDDDVLKALAICEGKLMLYIRNSSHFPSLRFQRQHAVQNADARRKFKMISRRFEFICRVLVHAVEQHSFNLDRGRIDIVADRAMKELPDFSKPGPIEGKVPGVQIGDEFLYRVQLAVVGLHRWSRGGIDWTKNKNGTTIAVSIVCSGGYPDEMSCSGELIYTGSGGKLAGKKHDANQKLMRGNLALKNCIYTKTPVRVIYGFKSDNVDGHSHSRAKKIVTYTYDGLYRVVRYWEEGNPGSRMLKYMLEKISGQPELPLHIAEQMRKSKMRLGLCRADISEGKEGTPICVINGVDDVLPAPFEYITRIKSAFCPIEVHSNGCGCTNGCSDSDSCSCARKNGGKFPFNFNGAIVSESPLIYECGPSCKCPPSCHNRVGQHGIKIPLEVFRISKKGWGVRSLRSISSGSFVCEYVGELLHSIKADQRNNHDYLFNIGHIKGSQPRVSGLNTCSGTMDDVRFTIDATEYGNVGRFINHSCSPNIFAQNVLWDHGDKRMPHIMFFAAETIPPLQELTCEYK